MDPVLISFFQDTKCLLTKLSQKSKTLTYILPWRFERVLPNTNSYFNESYFLFSQVNFPHPFLVPNTSTIKFPRRRIFKTRFRKLSILSKFWKWRICQGVRGRHFTCVQKLNTKIDMWLSPNKELHWKCLWLVEQWIF